MTMMWPSTSSPMPSTSTGRLVPFVMPAPNPHPIEADENRTYMLPCGPLDVPARGKVHCFLYPQKTFQVQRFLVPTAMAPSFRVDGIYARLEPQTVGPIPCSVFAETSFGVTTNFGTVLPGEWLLIMLKNTSRKACKFVASFMGKSPNAEHVLAAQNSNSPKPLTELAEGHIRVTCRFGEIFEGREISYHKWLKTRQRLYDRLFFPDERTQVIGLDASRFLPRKGNWWCNKHGTLIRAASAFEDDFALGRKIGLLTLIDPVTYEGFDSTLHQ